MNGVINTCPVFGRKTLRATTAVMLAAALTAGCSHARRTAPQATSAASAWQQVLRQIGPQGQVSRDTALAAFTLAIAPLPGVPVPPGPRVVIPSGTLAVSWVMRYWKTLSSAQQQVVRDALAGTGSATARHTGYRVTRAPTGPTPAPTGPQIPCQDADTATAAQYRHTFDTAIAAIAGRLGRTLPLPARLVVNSIQMEGTALAYTAQCGPSANGCTVHLNPSLFTGGYGPADLPEVLTHEAMHCFQYAKFDLNVALLPAWLRDGMAQWVAAMLSTQARVTSGWWKDYFATPGLGLFARSYDAVAFYAHLAETGTDVWSRLDAMMQAYVDALVSDWADDPTTPNQAAWKAADPTEQFLTTWGSGLTRGRFPGSAWTMTGPGLPGTMPEIPKQTIDNGSQLPLWVMLGPTAWIEQYDLVADVVTITAATDVTGRLGTANHDDLPLSGVLGRDLCTRSDTCTCPPDTPGEGTTLDRLAGGTAYLGVTGGLGSIDLTLSGTSLDEYCKKNHSNQARINAIARIIAQTSNSDDSFVEFHDITDIRKDGVDRTVQLSCDPRACYMVVPCDEGAEPRCTGLDGRLGPIGFRHLDRTLTRDYAPGTAHDYAARTEDIFRHVLGAAADYQLTWKSAAHPDPTPVPTS